MHVGDLDAAEHVGDVSRRLVKEDRDVWRQAIVSATFETADRPGWRRLAANDHNVYLGLHLSKRTLAIRPTSKQYMGAHMGPEGTDPAKALSF